MADDAANGDAGAAAPSGDRGRDNLPVARRLSQFLCAPTSTTGGKKSPNVRRLSAFMQSVGLWKLPPTKLKEDPAERERRNSHLQAVAAATEAEDAAVLKDKPPTSYRHSSSGRLNVGSSPSSPGSPTDRPQLDRISTPSRLSSYHSSPTMDKLNARKSTRDLNVQMGGAKDLTEVKA